MDTQNDGLEKVGPFKHSHFGIYVRFLGCISKLKIPSENYMAQFLYIGRDGSLHERTQPVDSVDSSLHRAWS